MLAISPVLSKIPKRDQGIKVPKVRDDDTREPVEVKPSVIIIKADRNAIHFFDPNMIVVFVSRDITDLERMGIVSQDEIRVALVEEATPTRWGKQRAWLRQNPLALLLIFTSIMFGLTALAALLLPKSTSTNVNEAFNWFRIF